MTKRRITHDERRARVGIRHRLAHGTRASTLADAAASMVVLHATDAASVFLEARARMAESSPPAIEHAMYDEPTALRLLAMRRTLFLVPLADVPMVHAAASRAIGETERRRTIGMLAEAGIGPDPARHLQELEAVGLAAVRERGESTTAELRALDPRLDERITLARGKAYEGSISVATKVFFHLALDGRIGRGRPRGTWIGGQFRWSPIERWLPGGIAELPVDDARAELVRRWLRAFGPGTRDDVKWWTGWTVAATRKALDVIDAVEVELESGQTAYLLPDDLERSVRPTIGSRCSPLSMRRRWDGPAATGTSARIGPGSSTRPAMVGRRSGSTAASSADGRSAAAARSYRASWRMSATRRSTRSTPKHRGCRNGSGRCASPGAFRRRSRSRPGLPRDFSAHRRVAPSRSGADPLRG